MRIGFLGGSFDPVHRGHLELATACLEAVPLHRVVFVVAGTPPHKLGRALAPAVHRVEMVRLATREDARFAVDDRETRREGPCFTIDTVRELREAFPGDELFWIIGADTLPELPTWRDALTLLDRIAVVSATRPGFDVERALADLEASIGPDRVRALAELFVAMPPVDVSSTEVRERVRQGRSIEALVPEAVRRYVEANGLYV